ncbi:MULTISPECIES: hypothetical protein [Bacillus]|nr:MULTISPECIES: hypothetical protein [Bacillus cereus group]EOP55041.1 hypothetical protein IIW_01175 [Bacillus cereus VD136]EOP73122.1 hypothetical protein KOW_00532 [Bacillus cereus VDM006]EOQ09234.1 hypothetical protein KOY_03203 [Bacillus cereus VDM021]OOG93605.1 N-acetylglutamate synthase [Bacillus mycoides]MDF2083806.1 hypothetical protein [Bacillus pseudomycoides]
MIRKLTKSDHEQVLAFLTLYPKEFSFLKRVQGDSSTVGGR